MKAAQGQGAMEVHADEIAAERLAGPMGNLQDLLGDPLWAVVPTAHWHSPLELHDWLRALVQEVLPQVREAEREVPRDRPGRCRTGVFGRSQRHEQALAAAWAERYVPGVSSRQVRAITEEWCGPALSSATISRATQALDEERRQLAERRLEEDYPYLLLDARQDKVRQDGVIRSRAGMATVCGLRSPTCRARRTAV